MTALHMWLRGHGGRGSVGKRHQPWRVETRSAVDTDPSGTDIKCHKVFLTYYTNFKIAAALNRINAICTIFAEMAEDVVVMLY